MKKVLLLGLLAVLSVALVGCKEKKDVVYKNASIEVVNTTIYNATLVIDTDGYLWIDPRSTDICYFNSNPNIGRIMVGKPLYVEVYLSDSNKKIINVFSKDNFVMQAGENWKFTVKEDGITSVRL